MLAGAAYFLAWRRQRREADQTLWDPPTRAVTGIGLARTMLDGTAQVLSVLVWPVLIGFVVWRLRGGAPHA